MLDQIDIKSSTEKNIGGKYIYTLMDAFYSFVSKHVGFFAKIELSFRQIILCTIDDDENDYQFRDFINIEDSNIF